MISTLQLNTGEVVLVICAVIGALATVAAACIGAWASIRTLQIGRENQRKLTTPGEGTGTIGQQVEQIADKR